ncbi:carboxylate-amine ligase [Roseimaritima ulvae]|uniref:Putative glutamate--cysteine ligase 2 n=1 Tax=Roseimaritima ulvae TaxID=980254 RepID=A0A5B9QKE6_9BACT|nr:YbdK family carboxylate-amine ligase [Roseimaritima ulvae]QEG38469.1 Carboxylate-amine ligase YbdK [Roseimaritima ulvae]
MTKLHFDGNARPTLGIELELGLVDQESLALTNACDPLLERLPSGSPSHYKPELMQCCIEINSGVCHTVAEARRDLEQKLRNVQSACEPLGLGLWWGATHPFSLWQDQHVTRTPRYMDLVDSLQEMARRLVTNGLHVHVGVESGDKAVMICDRIMQYLPTLLALSASSPYWEGRDTGLASHRSKIMEGLPTAGLPTLMRNWSEYVWLVNHMEETGFINSIREIWWDVRPHHNFGTVEVRVCDMPGHMDDACALAALIQCLVRHLSDQIDEGMYQFDCHPMMIRQNKWRASRFGLDATLVNSYNYQAQSVPEVVGKLIEQLTEVAQELGCETELSHLTAVAAGPNSAVRQRTILQQTGEAKEIVRQLVAAARL